MSKYAGQERRKFVRIPFWFVTWYREYPYEVNEQKSKGIGKNLSIGGICFESREEFKEGQLLEVELDTPALPAGVKIVGNVAWIKKADEKYLSGIEFKEIKQENLEAIKEIVNTFS